ncbi:DNA methyltransferase [Salmonella enterica]|uniref:DNA methyltransferase n=1 Tax=Salmonella enterica TaxID=28901 RepID=UPI0034CD3ABE
MKNTVKINSAKLVHADSLEFIKTPPVPYYPGKHPCEKPIEMMIDIISASTRPGDVVADFFMGSGSTIKAALQLGRQAIGVELEEERFLQTVSEIENL